MLGTIFKFYDCKFLKVYQTLDGSTFTWENIDVTSAVWRKSNERLMFKDCVKFYMKTCILTFNGLFNGFLMAFNGLFNRIFNWMMFR